MLKRGFDLCGVVLAAPLWVPLMGLLAGLVRLNLGAPVLFRQKRPGRGGVLFELIKFRSMRTTVGPDGRLLPDAERLTGFGRWLRASSLDELPELINVLRGEMSLVGPRPLLPEYLVRYDARQARRHEVRPGLTGLAQIHGRNALSWEEKLEWDVRYVEQTGFWLDLRILGRTVTTVLGRRGISAVGEATMPEFRPTDIPAQPAEGAGVR
jgi:lipopolysaccharide/colanic/teichoic acid biosynthesis glycosyltransferase